MEGRYHFHSPEWDDISDSAKNLVSSTLKLEEFTTHTCNSNYSKPIFISFKETHSLTCNACFECPQC